MNPRAFCSYFRLRLSHAASFGLSLFLLFCSLVRVPVIDAQALSGIQGTVTDDSGAVVPEAKVTVRNNGTGVTTSTVTSSAGTYTITDLIPGTYTVKIEKQGFQAWQSSQVTVEGGGKQATADATLNGSTAPIP